MEKAEGSRAVVVGIFIAAGLVIFVLGILLLGGQQKSFVRKIHLSALFSDVAGLKTGNNVWFSGVKVGTIESIKFTGNSQVKVQWSVDESAHQYIHRNAGVRLSSDGLIGNKIIVIDGGSPNTPIVEDGAVLQAEKILSTDDIMKTLQENNQNLLAITTDFKKVSSKMAQGKGMVGALMTDSLLAMQFRSIVRNLQNTTVTTANMATSLNKFSNKLNNKDGLADKLLTDTSVFHQLKASVNQLKQATASASTLTDNLNRASNQLNKTDNPLGVLLNDPKGAEQVRGTLNYLNQSSIKLNDDLEAVQHNFLLKGFFKKKEQAKQDSIKAANKK
jgi:phospholipid/cholesterol/gamma-HCH transport system substrate-binding protein